MNPIHIARRNQQVIDQSLLTKAINENNSKNYHFKEPPMTQIKLKQQELPIFIRIAEKMKESYHYVAVDNLIFLTASTAFLTKTGYL